MYMRKLAVGPRARGSIDLLRPIVENIEAIADAFGRRVNDVTTIVLDRPRHHDLIEEIRNAGARIKLIQDGDVTASISAAIRGTNDHLAIGIGGTGVSNGDLLRGVRFLADSARTHSLLMCTRCNWVRFVDGIHFFARERREEVRLLGF
jgi:fructose-1,6-bisphosphatase/sedoheptulose 1,7-bisphosphatase-like protein